MLASMMRRINICEERGSGVDKIVAAAEKLRLPAPDFRTDGDNSKAILYAPRPFRDTTPAERVRACYQHSVMTFMAGERMTNASLRFRLGIDERNAAQVSRVIGQALEERQIKQSDSWSARSGTYVPIWA
jgi:predicted HTH transcriptional regulator